MDSFKTLVQCPVVMQNEKKNHGERIKIKHTKEQQQQQQQPIGMEKNELNFQFKNDLWSN